jgi:HD-GYP domain-containing protein (c-di-GMP phosphodiesterase class II)
MEKEYLPLKFNVFNHLKILPCDVYIQLGSGKKIKIFNDQDEVDVEKIRSYAQKGVTHFFIHKEHLLNCGEQFFNKDYLKKQMKISPSEMADNALENLYSSIEGIGIGKREISQVEELHEEMAQDFSSKEIHNILDDFSKMKGTFLYAHSFLTSLFCIQMGKKLQWGQKDNLKKLHLAAIFHDMGYEDPNNALLEDLPKSKLQGLPKEKREDILSHPERMVLNLEMSPELPSDTINIVKLHHTGTGEEGYPVKIFGTELSQLNCVFILCHQMVLSLYKVAFREDKMKMALDATCEKYGSGNFKQLHTPFKELMTELLKIS